MGIGTAIVVIGLLWFLTAYKLWKQALVIAAIGGSLLCIGGFVLYEVYVVPEQKRDAKQLAEEAQRKQACQSKPDYTWNDITDTCEYVPPFGNASCNGAAGYSTGSYKHNHCTFKKGCEVDDGTRLNVLGESTKSPGWYMTDAASESGGCSGLMHRSEITCDPGSDLCKQFAADAKREDAANERAAIRAAKAQAKREAAERAERAEQEAAEAAVKAKAQAEAQKVAQLESDTAAWSARVKQSEWVIKACAQEENNKAYNERVQTCYDHDAMRGISRDIDNQAYRICAGEADAQRNSWFFEETETCRDRVVPSIEIQYDGKFYRRLAQ